MNTTALTSDERSSIAAFFWSHFKSKPKLLRKGRKAVFGIPTEEKQIVNIPEGCKIRIRYKWGQLATVFLRQNDAIERRHIYDNGDHWELTCPQEIKTRPFA